MCLFKIPAPKALPTPPPIKPMQDTNTALPASKPLVEKDKSNSLLIVGSMSSPNLSSLTCSLKKLVCGGSNANINLAANVTTALAPTDCHGCSKFFLPPFCLRSCCTKYGKVSSDHSTAVSRNCDRPDAS